MKNRIEVSYDGKHEYDIVFQNNFDSIVDEIEELGVNNRKICIVTDSNVAPIYASEVKKIFDSVCKNCYVVQFAAGELSKNQETTNKIYDVLLAKKFDRRDILVALGGGVVGDITGFVAATYLRGIDYIQIPTSLLSQVDSSVGGKTGIDFKSHKNMIGAFKMPKLVYINISTLNTLPERQFNAGMAEVIKYGLIMADDFFEFICQNIADIKSKNINTVSNMVYMCCRLKKVIVEKDPLEQGIRRILNFGHTFGHSIEKCKNFTLLHGECVSIGIVGASYMSYKQGNISKNDLNTIKNTLSAFDLPLSVQDLNDESILEEIMNDKKMRSGSISFIVLKKIGEVDFHKFNFKEMAESDSKLLAETVDYITNEN